MPFYPKPHQTYGGIDLHARTMDGCILNQAGAMLVHQQMNASPDTWLRSIAPYRDDLVVAVAWTLHVGLACGPLGPGRPFVLGHALSMQASHGGQAKHDTIDAQNSAVLLRGGMLPQADVSPADMRATCGRLRRRMHCRRTRAERLTHVQNTHRPSNLPESGRQIADKTNRAGVAERGADPAVPKSREVDLTLMGHDDERLRDGERSILTAAKPHNANRLTRLRTVPGLGEMLSLGLRDEMYEIQRFPRVQAFVSSCRLVQCAKASAGKRSSTSGTKRGKASLTWPFAEAAGLFLRAMPAGPQYLDRLEKQHRPGKALTVLAHKRARAVYARLKRATAVEMPPFLTGERARSGRAWRRTGP